MTKLLKSMHIYGSCRKNKTGVPLFKPLCRSSRGANSCRWSRSVDFEVCNTQNCCHLFYLRL